jgi:hypothetical protein
VNAHVVGGGPIRDFVFEGFFLFLFLVLWVGFLECESAVLSGGSRSSLPSSCSTCKIEMRMAVSSRVVTTLYDVMISVKGGWVESKALVAYRVFIFKQVQH